MFEQRWYTNEAVFSFFNSFEKGELKNSIIAMPTGTGKSYVIALIINQMFQRWPYVRVMMLVDDKRLINQNAEKLLELWPNAPVGAFSAGLNSKDKAHPIIFGGIQSVYREIKRCEDSVIKTPHFGKRDLIIIDECHMLNQNLETMYGYTISKLKALNPNLVVLGLSATPYRMKQGLLTQNGLFTDFCYDITDYKNFNRLVKEGYLSPLVGKSTNTKIDLTKVKKIGGEFNQKQLALASDIEEITYKAVGESIELAGDRISWLFFGAGIQHVEHITEALQYYGIDAQCVHSKKHPDENDELIKAFKNFEFRAIVNRNMMTKGFDHQPIDFIGDLGATESTNRHVQKLGRGTRPCEETSKQNCLVADFAGNIGRIGPVNDPRIPNVKGKCNGDAPIKLCPDCGCYMHPSVKLCEICGFEFDFKTKIYETARDDSPMKIDEEPIIETLTVSKVFYNEHKKKNSPPSMKVTYICGLQMFNEYVCFEHSGYASKRAREWWKQRNVDKPPVTTYEALNKQSNLRMPTHIRVDINKKYPKILAAEWR